MAVATKDTIYVDIDDEISAIIDKMQASPHKIVALVLPKRATVMQSLVNMKLLKKAAQDADKSLVLITSEKSVLPLAGVVGFHVASSLQSKPSVPPPPAKEAAIEEVSEADVEVDKSKSVGELSGDGEEAPIELDNTDPEEGKTDKKKTKKDKGDRKLRIPDFILFRKRLFLIIGAGVLAVILWILGFQILPKAKVTITTETSSFNVVRNFTASADVTEFDEANSVLPATRKEIEKTDSEKVPATGEKDLGNKATGTMTLKNCSSSDNSVTVSAGTRFNSGSLGFVTDEAVTLPQSVFSGGGTCLTSSMSVDVTAESGGGNYNLSARSYSSPIAGVIASGSAMTGGTTNKVKVVSASDINSAKEKILAKPNTARDELMVQFEQEGLYGLTETFKTGDSKVTSSPAIDEQAEEVTVTVTTKYSMLGVSKTQLEQIVTSDAKSKIDANKQTILDNGLKEARFRQIENPSANIYRLNMETTIVAGPQQDEQTIKDLVKGKKKGDAIAAISARPGIKDVTISYSPFWVSSTPKKTGKVAVEFKQVNTEQNDSGNSETSQ